jgi:lipopolysaccharide export LptBFGC system permease protein LptF
MFFAFLSGYFVPYTAKQYSLGFSFLIGSVVCLFSFISSIILVAVDNAADIHDKKL